MADGDQALRCERSAESAGGVELAVLAFAGDLDLAVAEELAEALEPGAGEAGVIADLTEVRFIDSAGIHALVRAQESARAAGRPFGVVVARDSGVDRVLAIAGLSDHLASHPSREAAIAAVAGGEAAV